MQKAGLAVTALDSLNRARKAWEQTQPQLCIDIGDLNERAVKPPTQTQGNGGLGNTTRSLSSPMFNHAAWADSPPQPLEG